MAKKTAGIEQQANTPGDDEPRFMVYVLRAPHLGQREDLYRAATQRLVDDLHKLDANGWEIAFVFPDGAHILMRRKAEWLPSPVQDKEKVDDK